jgi:hypothetical protein
MWNKKNLSYFEKNIVPTNKKKTMPTQSYHNTQKFGGHIKTVEILG